MWPDVARNFPRVEYLLSRFFLRGSPIKVDVPLVRIVASQFPRRGAAGKCRRGGPALRADVISFRDSTGNRVEAFHAVGSHARHGIIAGYRTGTQGVGHAVLIVPNIDAALKFYRDPAGLSYH